MKKLAIGSALWGLCAAWFFFPPPQAAVEAFFSRRWYRAVLGVMTPATQHFPYPLALVLLLVAAAAMLLLLVLWLRRKLPWSGLTWGARNLYFWSPVLVLWFILFWGAGYQRIPVTGRLSLDTSPITEKEVGVIGDSLLEVVRTCLPDREARETQHAISSISSTMARIVGDWDGRAVSLPFRVKAAPRGLLLANGTSGMCAPFTLEALVDEGLPDTAFVAAAAHELGHIAGFCAEDEASFIGYVAGLRSSDPFARYACALEAYTDLIRQLRRDEYRRAFDALPAVARLDLLRAEEARSRYRIDWFGRISWHLYDKYLQSQGVKEGVRSYSRGISLLGFAWRKGLVNFDRQPDPAL